MWPHSVYMLTETIGHLSGKYKKGENPSGNEFKKKLKKKKSAKFSKNVLPSLFKFFFFFFEILFRRIKLNDSRSIGLTLTFKNRFCSLWLMYINVNNLHKFDYSIALDFFFFKKKFGKNFRI